MFLVHTCSVMNVVINLSHVIKVAMRVVFRFVHFLVAGITRELRIEQRVHLELAFEKLQPSECETFGGPVGSKRSDEFVVLVEL